MKRILLSYLFVVAVILAATPLSAVAQSEPDAYVDNVEVEYDRGMYYVSFDLQVENMNGQDIYVILWPLDAETYDFISTNSTNSDYVSRNGYVYSYGFEAVLADSDGWYGYTLQIPFSVFPHSSGEITWSPYIEIQDAATGDLIGSGWFDSIQITNADIVTSSNPPFAGTDDAGCDDDVDCDGITDELELYLAESFMPVYEFDEEEHNLLEGTYGTNEGQDVVFLYQVSRVSCGIHVVSGAGYRFMLEDQSTTSVGSWSAPDYSYLFTVVATYQYDYLPFDPGPGEEDILNHYGDTERVRICIQWDDEEEVFFISWVFINRHHERGMYLVGDIPEWYDNSHPYLYVSEGKHATYVSERECHGAGPSFSDSVEEFLDLNYSPLTYLNPVDSWNDFKNSLQWAGFKEDCGSDGDLVIWPTVLESNNVGEYQPYAYSDGEYTLQHVTLNDLGIDMDPYGIEAVWSLNAEDEYDRAHYFCGGWDVNGYQEGHKVVIGYESPWCAGQLANKWWPPSDQR